MRLREKDKDELIIERSDRPLWKEEKVLFPRKMWRVPVDPKLNPEYWVGA
jgi:hypothetical protein